MKNKLILCLIIVLLLAGCTNDNEPAETPFETPLATIAETPVVTLPPSPTPTAHPVLYTFVYSSSPAYGGYIEGPTTEVVEEGAMSTEVTAVAKSGFSFAGWSDGVDTEKREAVSAESDVNVYAIFTLNKTVSTLKIDTVDGNGITSKTTYKEAKATFETEAEHFSFQNLSVEVKGHGNSTWNYFKNKKPSLNIKFDEKIQILDMGNGKAKNYVLLADYDDRTHLRTWIASSLGNEFSNVSFSSDCTWVSLYLNGDYMGLYMLVEKVEADDNRIDICDSGEDDDIGYLLELDKRGSDKNYNTDPYFVIPGANKNIVIKSNIATESQKTYIKNYVIAFYNACVSGVKENVAEYADIDSVVDMFIIEEFAKEADQGFASFYMVKEKGGKLKFTAPWDFNLTFGNTYVYTSYEGFVSWSDINESYGPSNIWFHELFKCEWFKKMVATRLRELTPTIQGIIDEIPGLAEMLEPYAKQNEAKLKTYGRYLFMEPGKIANLTSYDAHIDALVTWMEARLEYLNSYFKNY